MYLSAVLATMTEIFQTKAGKRWKDFKDQLMFLDNERIITLAMLADAGDESLLLARFYDTGRHDPATAVQVHEQYRMRIDYLFVQGHCWKFGFTRHALAVLQKTYTICTGNDVKSIGGGVQADVWERCLQRMRCWVYLATCTIQAEFPRWEVTQCMSVFKIADSTNNNVNGGNGHGRQMQLQRVAQVLGLSADRLAAQIDMVLPYVASIKGQSESMTTVDAWRSAIQRLSNKKSMRFWGKVQTLKKALLRLCAWQGSTTSAVEQMFSKLELHRLCKN